MSDTNVGYRWLITLAVAASVNAHGPAACGGDDVVAVVDQRVLAWQPVAKERRIDQIAWAQDIRAALRLGRESGRPIFLFTHDGRMGLGRQ